MPEDIHRMYVRYYNYLMEKEVTEVTEIPIHWIDLMSCYKYTELARPLVVVYRKKNMKQADIMHNLRLSRAELRTIGRRVGEYK